MAAGVWIIAVCSHYPLQPLSLSPTPLPPYFSLSLSPTAYFYVTDQAACDKLTWITLHKELIGPCCSQGQKGSLLVLITHGNPFPMVVSFVCTVHGYTCTGAHEHPTRKVVSYDVCTGRLPPPGQFHQILIRWHPQINAKLGSVLPLMYNTGSPRAFRLNVENM